VLAGGLVLGIGATITLASWNDSEHATGSFATSTFDLESSTVDGVWASNTSAPGAALAFNATALSPSVSRYAWINVRTTAASTVGGVVTLASSTNTGALVPVLEYRAVLTASPSTACDASAFTGTPTYIAGSAGTYIAASTVPAAAVATAITAPSAQVRYCFDVRVAAGTANSFQGATGTVTWLFSGVSS